MHCVYPFSRLLGSCSEQNKVCPETYILGVWAKDSESMQPAAILYGRVREVL